jgi:hypothetical protein
VAPAKRKTGQRTQIHARSARDARRFATECPRCNAAPSISCVFEPRQVGTSHAPWRHMKSKLPLMSLLLVAIPYDANAASRESSGSAIRDRSPDASPNARVVLAPRATVTGVLGVGPATSDLPAAVELTAQGTYWLGEHFGLGGRLGMLGFSEWLWPTHRVNALLLEPGAYGRLGARWVTGYVGAGIGPAYRDEQKCVDFSGWFGPCEKWSHDEALAFTASASAGLLFHPWRTGFTFGPQGRLQTLDTRSAATVGLALGGSL